MSRRQIAAALLGSAALLAAMAWSAPAPATVYADPREELFDPARLATLCRAPRPLSAGPQVAALQAMAAPDRAVPLDGLEQVHMPISTGSAAAQRWFDQGLALAYGFNHAEAARSFRAAQREDPSCAICFWGEALVLGPNINAAMADADIDHALAAIAEAERLAPLAAPVERALIKAQSQRYAWVTAAERGPLDQGYAAAMAEVAARFPEDDHVQILWAESMMNLQPWDYWEADGRTPRGNAAEIIAVLERVLARNPTHPQAIHLYIHMLEASAEVDKAVPHAERLEGLVPGAGHLVHMPAHIYYRIGRYRDSLRVNLDAMAADETFLRQQADQGIYAHGYYPHNIHFALVSAALAGDAVNTRKAARLLPQAMSEEVAAANGWVQIIMAAPYFAEAMYGDRASLAELAPPPARFPLIVAMWHYARGVTSAAAGDLPAAEVELAAIERVGLESSFDDLVAAFVPADEIFDIARLVLEARIAQAQGDIEVAIARFEEAVALQDTLPYIEPPFWYYPVRQSLGAALIAAGRPADAVPVLEAALVDAPNNGWALHGLAEAYRAMGEPAGERIARQRFTEAWAGAVPPELARL
jgi:tetratricopeptide (TPR) repeat protein